MSPQVALLFHLNRSVGQHIEGDFVILDRFLAGAFDDLLAVFGYVHTELCFHFAERFISVYNAYKQGKEITAKRLYLETMEGVLANSRKVILDPSAKSGNVLPILPLNRNNQTQESK